MNIESIVQLYWVNGKKVRVTNQVTKVGDDLVIVAADESGKTVAQMRIAAVKFEREVVETEAVSGALAAAYCCFALLQDEVERNLIDGVVSMIESAAGVAAAERGAIELFRGRPFEKVGRVPESVPMHVTGMTVDRVNQIKRRVVMAASKKLFGKEWESFFDGYLLSWHEGKDFPPTEGMDRDAYLAGQGVSPGFKAHKVAQAAADAALLEKFGSGGKARSHKAWVYWKQKYYAELSNHG